MAGEEFIIDPESNRNLGVEVKNNGNDMNATLDAIKQAAESMRGSWSGEDADLFDAAVAEVSKQVNEANESYISNGEVMQSNADLYDEIHDQNKSLMRNI